MSRLIAGDPQIVLGRAIGVDRLPDRAEVQIDLARLLVTRLLVQANSGGGKSWLLRRLLEQTFTLVPQVVLDIDDEFHTLREKYPYVLAGLGAGADCRADVQTAPLLARRVLEHGFSLIAGIYELKKHERMEFVRRFLEALIEAPRSLWRPLMVVVDEAHLFCPENDKAASAGAVMDLMTRGRKRGYLGVLATQRISKLHKDAAAEANNKLIGRSALDVDMKRAADELGFTTREQRLGLRDLDAGQFFAFGPAIAREVTLVKVGEVETTHPEPGSRRAFAPPPPPERLKAILSKLADLPKDAEAEEGEVDRLRRENAELRRRLARAPAATTGEQTVRVEYHGPTVQQLDAAIGPLVDGAIAEFGKLRGGIMQILASLHNPPRTAKVRADGVFSLDRVLAKGEAVSVTRQHGPTAAPAPRAVRVPTSDRDGLQPVLARVLDALAEMEGLGVDKADRAQVAFLAGYSNTRSKGFANTLSSARVSGLIEYFDGNRIGLTDEGRAIARPPARPTNPADLHQRLSGMLEPVQARVLGEVIKVYPRWVDRDELARISGYENPRSKGFANALSRLSGLGFVHYPVKGMVGARPLLFLEAR